jgi:hypothetical protein
MKTSQIAYIKGIHNTVADAVLQLEYDPSINQTGKRFYMTKVRNSKSCQKQNWMTVSNNWRKLDIDIDKLDKDLDTKKHDDWNLLFSHHEEEDKINPLSTIEIAEAQCKTKN